MAIKRAVETRQSAVSMYCSNCGKEIPKGFVYVTAFDAADSFKTYYVCCSLECEAEINKPD